MKHKSCKLLSNTNLNNVKPVMKKQVSRYFTSNAIYDPLTPKNAFRQESIKELLKSMKSLQISMMAQSSIDSKTQMQISNHASSTAKRLNKIIQNSNVYNSHYNDDNQNYLIDSYQCLTPSKTPKAIPSYLKKKFKDFLSLGGANGAKNAFDSNNSQCEHLNTEIKLQFNNNKAPFPSSCFDDYNSPLNEKLALNPEIKKKLDEYKMKKGLIISPLSDTKVSLQNSNKAKRAKFKKRIDKEILMISTIQHDANKFSRKLSKEILHEKKLPSISVSRSKAHTKTQVLLKVSSAYLETTSKNIKKKAKLNMAKAQNDYNKQSSTILHKAIDSLLNEDESLKTKVNVDSCSSPNVNSSNAENDNNVSKVNMKLETKTKTNSTKSIRQIDIVKEGFENINLDQKFNYNDGNGMWENTEKQKLLKKIRKLSSAYEDQGFLKEEAKKNHILKSIFPLTPRIVKFAKITSKNIIK